MPILTSSEDCNTKNQNANIFLLLLKNLIANKSLDNKSHTIANYSKKVIP